MQGPYRAASSAAQDGRPRLVRIAGDGLAIAVAALLLLFVLRLLMTGLAVGAPGSADPSPEGVAAGPLDEAGPGDEARHAGFVSFVLDDVQATWHEVFERHDLAYRDAELVLYRASVDSPCGAAPAASGPFYCQHDGNVYLDLSSYDLELERNGADVDLGETYAIAREIGHHVLALIGSMGQTPVGAAVRPTGGNRFSVALELQAACFAGVWAASADARGVLAHEDAAVGLSADGGERWAWFRTGFGTGDPSACDTFFAP